MTKTFNEIEVNLTPPQEETKVKFEPDEDYEPINEWFTRLITMLVMNKNANIWDYPAKPTSIFS